MSRSDSEQWLYQLASSSRGDTCMGEVMKNSYEGYRILLVHAHPDDETINNGATMALYASLGASVTLVTCTRGEEGEVLVPGLIHLSSTQEDLLGNHREVELIFYLLDFRFLAQQNPIHS